MRSPDQLKPPFHASNKSELPPWKPCSESERQRFIAWTIDQLDLLDIQDDACAEERIRQWDGTIAPEVAFRSELYRAKAAAHSGDRTSRCDW
jgi:hypothetical protein